MEDMTEKLLEAIKNKDAKGVLKACFFGGDVNNIDASGKTPVHTCIENGDFESFSFLMRYGGNANIQDKEGFSPLHSAINLGKFDFADVLLYNKFSNIELKGGNGLTPLQMATKSGDVKMVKLLLDEGAIVNAMGQDGKTALHFASERADLPLGKLLLDSGAQINAQDNGGNSPLHAAVASTSKGADVFVQFLEHHHADKHLPNKQGETPETLSSKNSLKMLLSPVLPVAPVKAVATPPQQNTGYTSLDLINSIQQENLGMVNNVLSQNSNLLKVLNNDHKTPLHMAIESKKSAELIRTMIHYASPEVLKLEDKQGDMAHAYLDDRENIDRIIKKAKLNPAHHDFAFIRAVVDPFMKNPYSAYNETFADTEIRKLIRRKGKPTMTKYAAREDGLPNRSTSLLDSMDKTMSRSYTFVGYGIENPDFKDISCVCDHNFSSGKGSTKKGYASAFHFSNPENGSRHHDLLQLRNTVHAGLLEHDNNTRQHHLWHDISEIAMTLKFDRADKNKIKFIFIDQSDWVRTLERTKLKVTDGLRFIMATYLKDKFKRYTHEELPLKAISHGKKVRDIPYPTQEELHEYLKQAVKDNAKDCTLLQYKYIDLWRNFGSLVKHSNDHDFKKKVYTYLNDLAKSNQEGKGHEIYNIVKCMKKCGMDNTKVVAHWALHKFTKELKTSTGQKALVDSLKKQLDYEEKLIKDGKLSNTARPHHRSDRKKAKEEIVAIRGELLMLEEFFINNKMQQQDFVKKLSTGIKDLTKRNGLSFEYNMA